MNSVTSLSGRPRIFVSSTIYDFRDFRSALRFWLNELGYDVQMSDHADFDKSLDVNSYEACLRTIDSCSYFILLIGARVGGWYNKTERISITRAEYRHAYRRFAAGQLTIVPFVRREVWDIREDRKALEDYLREDFAKTKELSPAEVDAIVRHKSKFVTDAESIFSFIDEVTRADEMRAAVKTGRDFPRGNWVHVFDTFQDVAAATKQAIGVAGNLRRRSLLANLKHEIAANLSHFLKKDESGHLKLPDWDHLKSRLEPQLNRDFVGESDIDVPLMNHFALLSITQNVGHLETTFLEEALNSGEFLDYDRESNAYVVGPLQAALIGLRDAIRGHISTSKSVSDGKNLLATYGSRNSRGTTRVQNVDLISPIFMLDSNSRLAKRLVDMYFVLDKGTAPQYTVTDEPPIMFDAPLVRATSVTDTVAWLSSARNSAGT